MRRGERVGEKRIEDESGKDKGGMERGFGRFRFVLRRKGVLMLLK